MNGIVGTVYLVGAGPGDPGLLTRAGAEALGRADVVVYDHLIHDRLLELAPPGAERIFAGKRRGKCPVPQEEINALLVDHARAGRTVARLKGGDPYVFGRGAEEAEHLHRAGVPFRVVPGVTAGVGATSYAGIAVTHRAEASAVAFVTGHNDPIEEPGKLDWPALARFPGTLIVYMGFRHHRAICRTLLEHGKAPETPAALVCSGTVARQRVVEGTLATLPDRIADASERLNLGPPALLAIGPTLDRRAALGWFERGPLFGRSVLITRPIGEADRSAADLEALGAEALVAPTVAIRPVEETGPMDAAIDRLPEFDWLVFTSANGVRHFLHRLEQRGRDLRALGGIRLAAIGPSTAEELKRHHLNADLVPASFRSEGLAAALAPQARGARVLLARADRGRELLREELARIAEVEQIPVYRNLDAPALPDGAVERIETGRLDWITITSSAIVTRLHGLLSVKARARIAEGTVRLASLSPVTSDTARRLGWPVAAEARQYTWPGLLQAIVEAERTAAPRQADT